MQQTEFFSVSFIESLMQTHSPKKNIKVLKVEPLEVDNSASILVALTSGRTDKMIGHFGLVVTYEASEKIQTRNMVMKIKPHGSEISEMLNFLATNCGTDLAEVYSQFKTRTGFQNTHARELEIYGKMSSDLTPEIYGLLQDSTTNTYIILMEYLQEVELLNSVMTPETWTDAHIRLALKQIARWHADNLDRTPLVDPTHWLDSSSPNYMHELTPLWEKLLQNAATNFPELYTQERTSLMQEAIRQIPAYRQELEAMPKTLVHNDLNPRNTCFKNRNGDLQFCVYDWELSTFHVPQYDVVEFLSFILDAYRYHLRLEYLEYYRQELHKLTDRFGEVESFQRGFALAALDFGLHRIGLYMMAHTVSPYPFLPRVVNSYFDTLEQFNPFPIMTSETAHIAPIHRAAHS